MNDDARLQHAAKNHLWMHFTRHGSYAEADVPIITRGEGCYLYDSAGRRYIDGLGGLFTSQLGHGRRDLAEAGAAQATQLEYMPLWSYAHTPALELAERIAGYAPGDLNRVFLTNSGSEAVETAWKLAKQYYRRTGRPGKHKVISRFTAYHGTTHGALSITGIAGLKQDFEPLVPSTAHVANTNAYRAPEITSGALNVTDEASLETFGRWAADQIAHAIEAEGPETVAAVFLEPVQNAGGCFPPPPGYFQRVREICDEYDVLLVSDEVICAFGRLGRMFGAERYGYQPDIITTAKGITSGYAPLGAMIATDALMEPFLEDGAMFGHGYTFGGHPVSAAVALKNLQIFEDEKILEHVQQNEERFRSTLERLKDLSIVGDVRGAGYFYGIELVKDKETRESFSAEESERILYGHVSKQLFAEGLYCRADDRGDPVIQLAPPLIADQQLFEDMEQIIRKVLTEAKAMI
ncbi:aspartate aminotransferase family protein [Nesterenkonia aerolata]|uniref:Aspartate aminotransferase family protein n=1 Tax=Nesterenkonia aerolata TaxID=3074079 RepID=A0ABU2DR94_9MICC|nr:aspartate aminotransferase family protein [Nesterenkonia sp. LY-0111]MDR8018900.1 aspartate aminotransferase family protein [Nesterenkonia sp. LY-0111]